MPNCSVYRVITDREPHLLISDKREADARQSGRMNVKVFIYGLSTENSKGLLLLVRHAALMIILKTGVPHNDILYTKSVGNCEV